MDSVYQPILATDLIIRALGHTRDRAAIVMNDGTTVTAGDLAKAISRNAQAFAALSPRPARAALLSRNRSEVPSIINAFSFAGIVSTALHPMGSVEDYLYVIEDAAIDLLVYDASYAGRIAEIRQRSTRIRHYVVIGEDGDVPSLLAIAADFAPQELVSPAVDANAAARIAYSGGTTGKPKGILVTHRALVTSTMLQMSEWQWPEEIRFLICAPLSHAGAAALTTVLLKSGTLYVLDRFDPVQFMEMVQRHRITATLMVPTMVLALIDHPRLREFDLSSLESIFYGASPFPAARLRDAIGALGPVFFQFYGQAEAPLSIMVLRKEEHLCDDPVRMASCGRPTSQVHVSLLDDDEQPVADGQPGEICVRGPLVMAGYLNKPEETQAALKGGWLHTGDVGIRSPDGFYRIVDRKKEMIITGGFNVFAREVEDVLCRQPGVRQAAVFGLPDPKWGEVVTAVIVADRPGSLSSADLISAVRMEKGVVQAPKAVHFVDEIPVTPLGKPDKKKLKDLFA